MDRSSSRNFRKKDGWPSWKGIRELKFRATNSGEGRGAGDARWQVSSELPALMHRGGARERMQVGSPVDGGRRETDKPAESTNVEKNVEAEG